MKYFFPVLTEYKTVPPSNPEVLSNWQKQHLSSKSSDILVIQGQKAPVMMIDGEAIV